ncbi:site-2 protease family protein [Actinoplanes sp. NPDC051343]|uniref:site-2 protease family protein n=1 Tax=Actinoplanes sp. NPDC051343 TaxID=3363906 RepID=UPI0037B0D88B
MTYEPVSTRRPNSAFVPSPIFLGIVAVFAVSGFMAWTRFGNVGVDVFLFVVAGWLVSLCLHEYGHAVAGYFSGDHSVADKGYLRLNPLKYTSPLLSIILPVIVVIIGGIGLPGGAVWIDHRHINSRVKDSLISATGPLANIVLALIASVPFLARDFTFADPSDPHYAFWAALALLAFLQVTAAILNLLPIPGLDGGGIVYPWLSREYQRAWNLFAPYGFILLFVLLWQSRANEYFFSFVYFFTDRLGLDSGLIASGFDLMRFWS